MATHELAEKTEAENLDEILSSYEKCSNECANFLAKLEGLDGVVFKELTNESKVSLSPELLSDIIRSAKEEIGRHKHNLSVIRRNMSKNRMKKITSNSAPIKAKELIDFLIHNGLIDVRRNASVVIKAFVSGFLSRFQLKSENIRASFDTFIRENKHVIRNNQGGTPDSNRRLAMNAFVRGFEEARVYQETGNESSAPLTMAIIHVTGGDIFGECDEEADKLVNEMCLQVPSLIRQAKKLFAELDRTVEMVEHAYSLHQLEQAELQATTPIEQDKTMHRTHHQARMSGSNDRRQGGGGDGSSPTFMAATDSSKLRNSPNQVVQPASKEINHNTGVHGGRTGVYGKEENRSSIKGERLFRDTERLSHEDDDTTDHVQRSNAHKQAFKTPSSSTPAYMKKTDMTKTSSSHHRNATSKVKRLTPQSGLFAETQSSALRKSMVKKRNINKTTTKKNKTSYQTHSTHRYQSDEAPEEEGLEEADIALEEMWRTLEVEDNILGQEAQQAHASAMNYHANSNYPPPPTNDGMNTVDVSPNPTPLHPSQISSIHQPDKGKSKKKSEQRRSNKGEGPAPSSPPSEAECLANEAIRRARDIAERAKEYDKNLTERANQAKKQTTPPSVGIEDSFNALQKKPSYQETLDKLYNQKSQSNDDGVKGVNNEERKQSSYHQKPNTVENNLTSSIRVKNSTKESLSKHSTQHVGKCLSPEKPKPLQFRDTMNGVISKGVHDYAQQHHQRDMASSNSPRSRIQTQQSLMVNDKPLSPPPPHQHRSSSSSPSRRTHRAPDQHCCSRDHSFHSMKQTSRKGEMKKHHDWIPGGGHKKAVAGDAALTLKQIEERHNLEEEKKKIAKLKMRDKLAARSRMRKNGQVSIDVMGKHVKQRSGIVQQAEYTERLYQGKVGPNEDEINVRDRMKDPLVTALNDLKNSKDISDDYPPYIHNVTHMEGGYQMSK